MPEFLRDVRLRHLSAPGRPGNAGGHGVGKPLDTESRHLHSVKQGRKSEQIVLPLHRQRQTYMLDAKT